MNSQLLRLFGSVLGAIGLGFTALVGMAAAAAVATTVAQGAMVGVTGLTLAALLGLGTAAAASRTGH